MLRHATYNGGARLATSLGGRGLVPGNGFPPYIASFHCREELPSCLLIVIQSTYIEMPLVIDPDIGVEPGKLDAPNHIWVGDGSTRSREFRLRRGLSARLSRLAKTASGVILLQR